MRRVAWLSVLTAVLWLGCEDQKPSATYVRPTPVTPAQPQGTTSRSAGPRFHNSKPQHPITEAEGIYTIRFTHYYAQGESTAVDLANAAVVALRKNNEEAYVTDLGLREALVTIGAFPEKNQALYSTWKHVYEDYYLKLRGGRESDFQRQMDTFAQGQGALGDRPWPVSIEGLQMRMKLVQGKITREQYDRWLQSTASPQ